jgi:FkbM family methyltransferase
MKELLKKILNHFGYTIFKLEYSNGLVQREEILQKKILELKGRVCELRESDRQFIEFFKMFTNSEVSGAPSYAQLSQDIVVLLATNYKRNGFFVEFGATNGVDLSNTYLLETQYGWKGILAEPATIWHEDLKKNRTADIEDSCVWTSSGQSLLFDMVEKPELSTVSSFSKSDNHAVKRVQKETYEVNTISLEDLLKKYNAPKQIDYLSVDTEGSEYEILKCFDFDKYDISIISVEHNHTSNRDKLFTLLTEQGYKRKFTRLSKWDDWYFREVDGDL